MALEDPRGGQLSEQSHQVKTLAKAREWYERAVPSQLPLTVEQLKTRDGRVHLRVFAASGQCLMERG